MITSNGVAVTARPDLVKSIIKDAKAHWGVGWANLTEDMRLAEVSKRVLVVLMNQDESTYDANPGLARIAALAEACIDAVTTKEGK